jgi:putative PIN family toxin of toxin-antitoxin system
MSYRPTNNRLDAVISRRVLTEIVTLPNPLPELPLACRDRDDAVFLHLAIISQVDVLVSGDADLTVLASAYPVISPSALQQLLDA